MDDMKIPILKFYDRFWLILFFAILGSSMVMAQNSRVVTGTVRATENNESLPGVNILVKGTSIGTTTNADGKFSINVADDNAILVFSFIGYTSQEMALGGRTTMDVSLTPDIQSLSEVVIVGYGEQERRDLTGAVSSVRSKDFENIPIISADAMLQGRAAGVVVINNSGAPGSGVTVRIRGTTSINASNEPLYVIDGVPVTSVPFGGQLAGGGSSNPLADINPNDIASMEVLKDAAATAIYGARAANGVILITTKRGVKGTGRLSFNAYTGITKAPDQLPLLTGPEMKTMFLEGASNAEPTWFTQWPALLNDPTRLDYPLYNWDTDWQSLVRQDGKIQDYNISFRGGTEQLGYSISTGYTTQDGTVVGSGFERFTTNINVDYKISEKVKIGNSVRISRSETNRIDEGNNFSTNPYALSMFKMPFLSPWRIDQATGEVLEGVFATADFQDRNNPYQVSQMLKNNQYNNRAIGNVYLSYDILPGLNFRTNMGLDFFGLKESRFAPDGIRGINRQAYEQWTQDITWINENILTYSKVFSSVHNFSALVGYTNQKSKWERITGSTDRMIDNTIQTLNAGPNFRDIRSGISEWGISSLLGRVNYIYNDKYSVSLNIRRDVSSKFGPENRAAVFPAVSAFWRVSAEPFFGGVTFLDDFKIRGSIGQTGNQDIPSGAALTLYGVGANYSGAAGVAQSNLAAPGLGWETTTKSNIGVDFSMFNSRVTVIADYYVNNTEDLLVQVSLPNTSGFGRKWDNVGNIRNQGIELNIIGRIFQGPFTWNVDFNAARQTNKIERLLNDEDLIVQRDGFFGIARVGESLGTFYGYRANGIYASDSDNENGVRNNSSTGYLFKGGDVIFEDINGDNVINLDDRVVIGSSLPDFFGGLNNTFTYKNFDLNIFLNFEYGKDVINATRQRLSDAGSPDNTLTASLRRWRQQGDITDVPIARRIEGQFADNNRQSTRWLEDGSYLRVKAVRLSYNIPSSVFRDKIQGVRVYVAGNNLLTFSKYLGQDPEFAQQGSPILNGIDYFNYPQSRVYTMGLTVNF